MRRRVHLWMVLLGALFLFLPAIHYSFVYDDYDLIVANKTLTSWSHVPAYFQTHLFSTVPLEAPRYYRPLHLLALRIVYALAGPPSGIWHLAPVLIHLAAVTAVFLLIRRLTGHHPAALLAATVFAIHPIQTEAVAWVSCICDPLMTTFVVLSVYFYIQRKTPISFLSLLFATLAMFTKEPGILIPALIFSFEWTQSRLRNAAAAAVPYLIPAIAYAALRIHAIGHFSNPSNGTTIGQTVRTWPRMLASYAVHLVWPVKLSSSYDVSIDPRIWPLIVLVIVASAGIWMLRRASATVRFGAAWFVITMAPVMMISQLDPIDFVHDRYLYLPLVGLLLMLASGLSKVEWKMPQSVAAVCLAALLALGTYATLPIWRNEISLFQRALQTAPRNPQVMNNLAVAYLDANRLSDAHAVLEKAVQLAPGFPWTYYNLANYYWRMGDKATANHYTQMGDRWLAIARGRKPR